MASARPTDLSFEPLSKNQSTNQIWQKWQMLCIDVSWNDIPHTNFDHNEYQNCHWQCGEKGSLRYSQVIRQGLSYCFFLKRFIFYTVTSCLDSENVPAKVESSCQRRNSDHKMNNNSEKPNKISQGHAFLNVSIRKTHCKRSTECPVKVFLKFF